MTKNFRFTLFDYTGSVEMETLTSVYTYFLDGAVVRRAEAMSRRAPGRALNLVKRHTTNVQKKEKIMSNSTQAGKMIRRNRAVEALAKYMREHGNFEMFRNGKSLRVFPAPCECPANRITGILFYKWVKRNSRYKTFDRLILHTVCYKCMKKSFILAIDPVNYDPKVKNFAGLSPFLKKHNLKHWQFKAV